MEILNSNHYTSLIQAPKDVTTFSDTMLLAPGVYTYKVEPIDENGSSLEIQPAVREIVVKKGRLFASICKSIKYSRTQLGILR